MPERKLALVEALKVSCMIVAMTGDGITDAPALKAAQVGLAMGKRGGRMWLGKRPTSSGWPTAFRPSLVASKLGRPISANLRKAFIYFTATHIPIAGRASLPVLFALPPLFFPMHVVLPELASDPVCSLVFETEPPLLLSLAQGIVILTTVFSIYYGLLHFEYEVTEARACSLSP
jgi:Ca2+-transporting ATPase